MKKVVPCWSFLWIYCSDYEADKDGWKSKKFKAPTLLKASEMMLEFLDGGDEVYVDYEAVALHIPYEPKKHCNHFRDLRFKGNPLEDYIQ